MDIRRFLLTLQQQIWLLLGLTLAVLSAFLLIPQLGKKVVYVSRAKILLTPSQRATGFSEGGRGVETGNWLADEQTLQLLNQPLPGARLFVAAKLGATRLIDNFPVIPR